MLPVERDFRDAPAHKPMPLDPSVEGLSTGYELFPGNTADVHTLQPALEVLKGGFRIGNVVLVADAGMLSQRNLDLLASEGWDWGCRTPVPLAACNGSHAFRVWRIKDGFRVLKHTMMTRPAYHWTPAAYGHTWRFASSPLRCYA